MDLMVLFQRTKMLNFSKTKEGKKDFPFVQEKCRGNTQNIHDQIKLPVIESDYHFTILMLMDYHTLVCMFNFGLHKSCLYTGSEENSI